MRGNVFDLAVGIIIGTAFASVVKSLVDDIMIPSFGLLLGGGEFVNLTISIKNFIYTNQPLVVIRYGKFIQTIIYLLVVALVLFFLIKMVNKLHELAHKMKTEMTLAAEFTEEIKVLHQIRDLLSHKKSVHVHPPHDDVKITEQHHVPSTTKHLPAHS